MKISKTTLSDAFFTVFKMICFMGNLAGISDKLSNYIGVSLLSCFIDSRKIKSETNSNNILNTDQCKYYARYSMVLNHFFQGQIFCKVVVVNWKLLPSMPDWYLFYQLWIVWKTKSTQSKHRGTKIKYWYCTISVTTSLERYWKWVCVNCIKLSYQQ